MQFEKTEKLQGQGESTPNIGYFLGSLISVNPSAKEMAAIYGNEPKEDAKDTEYVAENYTLIKMLFKEAEKGTIVPWNLFVKDKDATWGEGDETNTVHINQHGKSFVQKGKEPLPDWFTELAIWDNDDKKFVKVKRNGKQVMLETRVAKEGEAELYGFLRTAIKVDWFTADEKTTLFIPFKDLLKGKVGEIKALIKDDALSPVVGMLEVAVKTVENEIKHYPNCISKCWMEEKELKACKLYTSQGRWDYLGSEEAKANKKLYNIRSFYYWAKKSKNCVEFNYLRPFSAENHIAGSNEVLRHSEEPTGTLEYDSEI